MFFVPSAHQILISLRSNDYGKFTEFTIFTKFTHPCLLSILAII